MPFSINKLLVRFLDDESLQCNITSSASNPSTSCNDSGLFNTTLGSTKTGEEFESNEEPARTLSCGNINAISFNEVLHAKYDTEEKRDPKTPEESEKRLKGNNSCARSYQIDALLETFKYIHYQCSINPKYVIQPISSQTINKTDLALEQFSSTECARDASLQESVDDKGLTMTSQGKNFQDQISNSCTYCLGKIKKAMFRTKLQNYTLSNRVKFCDAWKLEDVASSGHLVGQNDMALKHCRTNLKIEASSGLNEIQDIIREEEVRNSKPGFSNKRAIPKKRLEEEGQIPKVERMEEKKCEQVVCKYMISNDLFKFRWQEGSVHDNVENKIKNGVVNIRQRLPKKRVRCRSEERAFKYIWQKD